MLRSARIGIVAVAAAAGVAAAVGVAAGDDDIRACVNTASGAVREAADDGGCARGEIAVKFKSSGKTLTINGVAFARGRRGITINGTAFTRGRRGITINGNAFRSSGNTLTINGTTFQGSPRRGITINGTAFAPGTAAVRGPTGPAGPQGPAGAAGQRGPTGPAGAPASAGPIEVAGPVTATAGAGAADLASAAFTSSDGSPHRLLVTGGFSADCGTCNDVRSSWTLALGGSADPVVARRLSVLGKTSPETGASISEVVVTPSACGPCTLTLRLAATAGATGSPVQRVDATDIRLALVDLGPA